MNAADVSVIIPTYNRAYCLGRALNSVLRQDAKPGEILVVDDASTDGSADLVRSFGPAVRYVRHDVNQGAAAARNSGLALAQGALVAFLDSDDEWRPTKLARQLAFMQARGITACCTEVDFVWPDGTSEPSRRPYPADLSIDHLVWGCFTCPGSTLVADRSVLQSVGGYRICYPRYEDWDLLIRLSLLPDAHLGYLAESLAVVSRGAVLSGGQVKHALDLLVADHHAPLRARRRSLARRFRAAVAFARGADHSAQGRSLPAAFELAKSIAMSPFGHQPLRIVLLPLLRRRAALRLGRWFGGRSPATSRDPG